MDQPNNGGPAFPVTLDNDVRTNSSGGTGMTLRDYFAAKALPVAAEQFKRFAYPDFPEEGMFVHPDGFAPTARAAYAMADAMLVARGES
jgi:hypothetical protein